MNSPAACLQLLAVRGEESLRVKDHPNDENVNVTFMQRSGKNPNGKSHSQNDGHMAAIWNI